MSAIDIEPLDKILALFEKNPRDWLTIEDFSRETGLSTDIVSSALLSHSEKFKRRVLMGVPIFGLVRHPQNISMESQARRIEELANRLHKKHPSIISYLPGIFVVPRSEGPATNLIVYLALPYDAGEMSSEDILELLRRYFGKKQDVPPWSNIGPRAWRVVLCGTGWTADDARKIQSRSTPPFCGDQVEVLLYDEL